MKKTLLIASLFAAVSLSAANFAACASCHGQKGEKKALGKSQIIAGWDATKIVKALQGYKAGTYGGVMKGVMRGQAARLSDADMQDLANQISKF